MTWNAFGIGSDGKLVSHKRDGIFVFQDPILEQEFARADNEVRSKSLLKSDPYLSKGGIKESTVLMFIIKATNANPMSEDGWTTEEVVMMDGTANWDFPFEPEEAWAYWSGLIFLRTCAQHNLGIWFNP
jgi:hypothetical protein